MLSAECHSSCCCNARQMLRGWLSCREISASSTAASLASCAEPAVTRYRTCTGSAPGAVSPSAASATPSWRCRSAGPCCASSRSRLPATTTAPSSVWQRTASATRSRQSPACTSTSTDKVHLCCTHWIRSISCCTVLSKVKVAGWTWVAFFDCPSLCQTTIL